MEKSIKIKTGDGHYIYGTLNTSKSKSDRLIIFVHGLDGHKNEHIYYNSVDFFNKKGFSTFRFDFYSGENKSRNLSKTTISTQVKDLDVIRKYFSGKFKKNISYRS